MKKPNDTQAFFVEVPGGVVFTRQWTPQNTVNKHPIILLHESLGCIETWRDFPNLLAEKTKRVVIAYDRLGFGRSSPRQDLPSYRFMYEEAEIYFPKILDALNIGSFSIFGHSVGGTMALICAGIFPDRCSAIITESAQAFVEDQTRAGILKAKDYFKDPAQFSKIQKYHGDKAAWVLRAWMDIWLSPDFANWNLEADLPKVYCPLLAIHGDQDDYGSTKFPQMICDLSSGPSHMHIIPNTGHVPHRDRSELILNLVHEFLETI